MGNFYSGYRCLECGESSDSYHQMKKHGKKKGHVISGIES